MLISTFTFLNLLLTTKRLFILAVGVSVYYCNHIILFHRGRNKKDMII